MTKLVVVALAILFAGAALATIGRRRDVVAPPTYRRSLGAAVVVALWVAVVATRGRVRVGVLAAAVAATWLLFRVLFPRRRDR